MRRPQSPRAATPSARKRILLVDDHPFMRAGLAQLINKQADLVVCGEAGSPAEAAGVLAKTGVDETHSTPWNRYGCGGAVSLICQPPPNDL